MENVETDLNLELVQKFIDLFKNSNNLNISLISETLGISREDLFDSLVSWSDYIDFNIEDDRVNVDNLSALIQARENLLKVSHKYDLPVHESFEGSVLYQNVPLHPQEAHFLLILEQLIQMPLLESGRHNFLGGFVAENGHIIMLGLDHKVLTQLPDSIAALEYLEVLNLEHLQLKYIPESIVQLSNLSRITLNNNKLKTLPHDLGLLGNLTSLNLDDNVLESLPKSLVNCSNLKNLSITRNHINLKESFDTLRELTNAECVVDQKQAFRWTQVGYEGIICNSGFTQDDFVDEIFHLDSMLSFEDLCAQMVLKEKIDERYVKPEGFERWDIKKEPQIRKNLIDPYHDYSWALFYQEVPLIKDEYDIMVYLEELLGQPIPPVSTVEMKFGFIAEEGHVVELGLYYLNIVNIPDAIVLLTRLRNLFIGNNQLSSIPQWVGNLTSLESLNLQENQIFSIPEIFSTLTNLRRLDISHNRILALPKSMEHLRKLNYLNIEDNKLNLQKSKDAINKLKKNGCNIESIDAFRMRKVRL